MSLTPSRSRLASQQDEAVDRLAAGLVGQGFVVCPGSFADPTEARSVAESVVALAAERHPPAAGQLVSLGSYRIPPAGAPSRGFQVLHVDFGIPINPGPPVDVAVYTALYVSPEMEQTSAVTRLIALRPLLAQRDWHVATLRSRLERYGASNGALTSEGSYLEGVLARLVEAASDEPPVLPPVSQEGFLCGHEFDSEDEEADFFRRHGLRVDDVESRVSLEPGELLIFSNLDHAHGRMGTRGPEELHQWMFGHHKLTREAQELVLQGLLGQFEPREPAPDPVSAHIS